MRKQMKKVAAVLTSAVFAFGMMPAFTGFAAAEKATTFTFSETGITVSEGDFSDYEIDGTDLKITGEGDYVVTGECSDGSITVKKKVSGVSLTLSDLTLSNQSTAPLSVNKYAGAEIIIEGEVTLSDSINNSEDYLIDVQGMTEDEADEAGAENAVVKLKGASDVTISGTGTLNITARAKNGIKSGAALDADGEDTDPEAEGADTATLLIKGITLNIDATDVYDPHDNDTHGDGINGECVVWLESGTYNVAAGDDGIHCDYYLNIGTVDGGNLPNVNVTTAEEGLEGALINIMSGDIDVTANEDAINAANSDLSGYQFGIMVTGGDIYAVAGGDGDAFDSNGTITITDGNIMAFGGQNGNAFDTGTDGDNSIASTFTIKGGTILGLGITQMAVNPSSGSQGYAIWTGQGGFGGGQNPFGGENGFNPFDGENGQNPFNGENGFNPFNGENGQNPFGGENGFNPFDGQNGERPERPSDQNGNFPGGNGGFPGGNTGSTTGTVTDLTLLVGSTSYASGEQISIASGNTVSVKNGEETLISTVAPNAASYVIFSAPNLNASETPTDDPSDEPGQPEDQPSDKPSDEPGQPSDKPSDEPGQPSDKPTDEPGQPSDQPASGRAQRFYNPNSGEHFYTIDRREAESLKNAGWNDEGECFGFAQNGVPVYRVYNPNIGDHFFTTDLMEARSCIKAGWTDEGIAWYDDPSTSTAFRLYNPNSGRHFFTESEAEARYLVSLGWKDEGLAW